MVHPVEQAGAGLLYELPFKTGNDTVVPFAVIEEVETGLFRLGVPLPVEPFIVFHDQSPSAIKSFSATENTEITERKCLTDNKP